MKFIAALLFISSAFAQDPLLWGSLEPGRYQVGFQSSFQFDSGRRYDPDYTQKAARKPRPILADIWYPARDSQMPRLRYRDYFDLPPSDEATEFATRLSRFARETASGDIFAGKKPAQLDKDQLTSFDRFLSTTTFASKDAPPTDGQFPVVIYHSGAAGSFEDNSVLFEYLASRGYVVVSSAYESPDSSYVSNNRGKNSKSIRDMAFLTAFAGTLPFAESKHLAAIGHSAGAQTILQWLGEPDCPLDAAVSLDTTVEYSGLDSPLHVEFRKALEASEGRPRVPILLFASAQFHPKFNTWDEYLAFAPRYFASTKNLTHNDYLMHGALYGRPGVRRAYDRMCVLILQFLDATLKQDTTSVAALRQTANVRYQESAPAIPTARQIAVMIQTGGIAKWNEVAREIPSPFFRDFLYQAGLLLLEENQIDEARHVHLAYAGHFPKSFLGPLLLGRIEAKRKQMSSARAAFFQASELLKADKELPAVMKTFFANQIRTELAGLGAR